MKKFLSVFLVIAVLCALSACAVAPPADPAEETTQAAQTTLPAETLPPETVLPEESEPAPDSDTQPNTEVPQDTPATDSLTDDPDMLPGYPMDKEGALLSTSFSQDSLSSEMQKSYDFMVEFLTKHAGDWVILNADEYLTRTEKTEPFVNYSIWIDGYSYEFAHRLDNNQIYTDYQKLNLRLAINRMLQALYPDYENSGVRITAQVTTEGSAYDYNVSAKCMYLWEQDEKDAEAILHDTEHNSLSTAITYPSAEAVNFDSFMAFENAVKDSGMIYNMIIPQITPQNNADASLSFSYDSQTRQFTVKSDGNRYLLQDGESFSSSYFLYDALGYDFEVTQVPVHSVDLEPYREVYRQSAGRDWDAPDESLSAFKITKKDKIAAFNGKTEQELSEGKDYTVVFDSYSYISVCNTVVLPSCNMGDHARYDMADTDSVTVLRIE